MIDKPRKNKSFNTTTLIVVEPRFKSYFKFKIKGLDCSFQCYAFSRVKKCFVKGVLFQKRRIENPNIFQLLQQGVFEGNVGWGASKYVDRCNIVVS